jgi:hypothetical protein
MKSSRPGLGERFIVGLNILACAAFLSVLIPASQAPPAAQTPAGLKALLDKAAEYCDKLSHSVLDFVCRERIEEWLYPEATPASSWLRPARTGIFVGRRETNAYTYDYQLIRDRAGSIRENRTLLLENGKGRHVPEAPLKTRLFWHAYIVMGPLGLLSRERQTDHDYRVAGEEKVGKEMALIVEAVPKPGLRFDHLVGRIWLRPSDAGVLKIEWDPSSIENYAGVEEAAKRFQMTPRVVLTSEYAFEKNGIRFPSRYIVKEIYIRGGRHFQRSETDIFYDQYKFFTVETQVTF